MLRVLLITTTTLLCLAKRKEIAAACALIFLCSLLVLLNKAFERNRIFYIATRFWNIQNINKYPKCPVWALQTKKLKQAIFIAPSSLVLESPDKSAASDLLFSRAVTVGASPVASSDCLGTQVALVLQCKSAIAVQLCQPFHLSSLQWTNILVLWYEHYTSQNMCIVTSFLCSQTAVWYTVLCQQPACDVCILWFSWSDRKNCFDLIPICCINWLLLEYSGTGLCFISFSVLELLPETTLIITWK